MFPMDHQTNTNNENFELPCQFTIKFREMKIDQKFMRTLGIDKVKVSLYFGMGQDIPTIYSM